MRSPGRSRETKNPKYGRKAPARASVSETDKKFNLIKTITTMKYLIRSVKYFIALCVLYLIIMALMLLTNTSVLTPSETFSALVRSTRGHFHDKECCRQAKQFVAGQDIQSQVG